MSELRTRWRSLLFVPADQPALIGRAHERGASALILDLEDAVAADRKAAAREGLGAIVEALAARTVDVLVRVNAQPDEQAADLDAAVRAGVRAIVLPKVEAGSGLATAAAQIEALESKRGLSAGSIGTIPMIESPRGLFALAEIAPAPRVIGLALGTEDFALALGVPPAPAALTLPCQLLALAAASAGCAAFGMPVSIADFRALDGFRAGALEARAMGATGAFCIHPAQVAIVNKVFAPSQSDIVWAESVLAAWEAALGRGASTASLHGAMIDKPIVERAQSIRAAVR